MNYFVTEIKKFGENGEKTGWIYIDVLAKNITSLRRKNRKSFRVNGRLDKHPIKNVALLPAGEGNYIMVLNAELRKMIGKQEGDMLEVTIQAALVVQELPDKDLSDCLRDDLPASRTFYRLSYSQRQYFSKWVKGAKTIETKAERISQAINALGRGLNFQKMMRERRDMKDQTF